MISVIIPIYNVERYLERCLQSVINQTFKDIEIILVDDGSPDKCPHICDKYAEKDNRIKVIHKQNGGLSSARNAGLNHAKGEYVTFIDSDDFVHPNMIERLYRETKTVKYDIVYGAVYYGWSEENGNPPIWYQFDEIKSGKGIEEALADLTATEWNCQKSNYRNMAVWCSIFKRDIIDTHHITFKSEREILSEDYVFDYDLYPHVSVIRYISEPLYYYCSNGSSLSNTFKPDKIECIDRMYNYLLSSSMAQNSTNIRQRLTKLYLYYSGNHQRQILLSDLSLREKKTLSKMIYKKNIWKSICTEYQARELPDSYKYYLDVFLNGSFCKAYLKQMLYGYKQRLIKCFR